MSKHFASLVVAALALVASLPSPAQDKLDRPVRILVGFAAGGTADLMARLVADKMKDTIVIHGEQDDVVPLADVFEWARPQSLAVTVFPGCGHFFHGHLPQLARVIAGMWNQRPGTSGG